jgi:hypothetical protein
MKGYRTIYLNIVMTLAMGGTIQYSSLPHDVQALLTLGAAIWGFTAILLRLITTTPIGQDLEGVIEKKLGVSHAALQAVIDRLPQGTDYAQLVKSVNQIGGAVTALRQTHAATAAQVAALKLDGAAAAEQQQQGATATATVALPASDAAITLIPAAGATAPAA